MHSSHRPIVKLRDPHSGTDEVGQHAGVADRQPRPFGSVASQVQCGALGPVARENAVHAVPVADVVSHLRHPAEEPEGA